MRNTILWGNTRSARFTTLPARPSISDSVVQGGCPSDSTCTNVITADPLLGALGNYGGTTPTIPLLPGSSAINATSTNCPAPPISAACRAAHPVTSARSSRAGSRCRNRGRPSGRADQHGIRAAAGGQREQRL